MATVDRNHDLRRAQRRFSLRFGLAIALTGLPFLFLAGFVVRPIVVRNFKEHLVEELAVPIVEATAVATQGRPPLSTQVILHNRKLRLWTTLGDQTVELGEFDLPGEQSGAQLIAAFIICSGIGVASALAFAWPWTRRLRRVVQAFGAVGHSGGASKIEVTSNDVIGQIALGFNEMVERIEGSLEEREALIQAVSHELATPLSRMRLLLSIGDEVDRVALRHELTELEALAEELVAYVEQDTCRALEREGCDAMDVTRQTTETHRNWTRKDLGFESDVEAARVVGDERSLERCVANLLRNAERHARHIIRVRVFLERAHVRIEVHDDGPGVPPEQRERIFLPFARVESGRDRSSGGVGLGLALVARIVARHGGQVFVEESPLRGAKFVVDWPRLPPCPRTG